MGLQPIENKALSWGIIRKSACILAEIMIRKSQFITAPIVVIVEAKNENLKGALGQCAAEMVAAQLFNEREGHPIPTLFGVATTGSLWQFLKLRGKTLTIDRREYHIERVAKIVGILMWMIRTGEEALVQSET